MNSNNDVMMREYNTNNSDNIPKIRVAVRKRPLNKKEIGKSEMDIIDIRNGNNVIVKELKNKVDLTKYVEEHNFTFDMAFDETTTNEVIYLEAVRPMIEAAFNKTKVTCFAYGQTGSGKTFTMMGPSSNALEMGSPGLYLLSAYDIFSYLEFECYNHLEIWVSFYEIYCGKLFDLLNERTLLTAREDGKQNICIVGLTERQATNLSQMMQLIELGLKARTVGVTGANSDSSRSHGIIQISIKEPNGNPHGKISFIDLAGSERAADTIDTNKQTRIDGAEINKSLLALKECIRALDQDKKHTPFRGSKLTLVLRDSFMGNCKTLMIANISPCLGCSEHTLNTLRYADRVKELRGKDGSGRGNNGDNMMIDQPKEKDPNEILANLLMMPRQHNKTVKYNVDKNMNPLRNSVSGTTSTNNLNNFSKNNSNSNLGGSNFNSVNNKKNQSNLTNNFNMNINNNMNIYSNPNSNSTGNFFNNVPNSSNTSNTKSNTSINNVPVKNKENSSTNIESHLFNLLNNKKPRSNNSSTPVNNIGMTGQQNNNSQNNNSDKMNNFFNSYKAFNNRDSYISQNSQSVSPILEPEVNEEELQKLSDRHEKLINKILIEEESYIENHRKHVDEMVEIMKDEMASIHTVEKTGSDIEAYVNSIEQIFNRQSEKINFMKLRLNNFKKLLQEESEISQKFMRMNELLGSAYGDSFTQSSVSKLENNNMEDEF